MSFWLPLQFLYTLAAWTYAARIVFRTYEALGLLGRELPRLAKEAVRRRGRGALRELAAELRDTPAETLLDLDPEEVSHTEHAVLAEAVCDELKPPAKALRALATIGTSLGMLAAVASLHWSLGQGDVQKFTELGTRAIDSAVLGFVTALPCWTALALSRQAWAELCAETERLTQAIRPAPADETPETTEASALPK